jgi:hypothetical protein
LNQLIKLHSILSHWLATLLQFIQFSFHLKLVALGNVVTNEEAYENLLIHIYFTCSHISLSTFPPVACITFKEASNKGHLIFLSAFNRLKNANHPLDPLSYFRMIILSHKFCWIHSQNSPNAALPPRFCGWGLFICC